MRTLRLYYGPPQRYALHTNQCHRKSQLLCLPAREGHANALRSDQSSFPSRESRCRYGSSPPDGSGFPTCHGGARASVLAGLKRRPWWSRTEMERESQVRESRCALLCVDFPGGVKTSRLRLGRACLSLDHDIPGRSHSIRCWYSAISIYRRECIRVSGAHCAAGTASWRRHVVRGEWKNYG